MSTLALLPGQAAAPPGEADMSMNYVLHHAFRRDLRCFAEAARRTPRDERVTWRMLLARWEVLAEILHDHHRKEDEILWPVLHEKVAAAGDTAGAEVLVEMEAEHALIDPLLAACREGFAELADGAGEEVRTTLVRDLEETVRVLGAHLDHEEREAMVVLQRHLGGEEWDHLERTRFRRGLTLQQLIVLVPWALKGLPDDARRQMLGEAFAFRVVRALLRGQFERLDRAAFRHVPAWVGAEAPAR